MGKWIGSGRPSPALIVAVIALVAALAGTALAGTDGLTKAVTKSKVKKIAKTQADKRIDARVLKHEPLHLIGAAGEPAFQNEWSNYGTSYSSAGFYKDPSGIVHLQGTMNDTTDNSVAFTLPAGYRPGEDLYMPAAGDGPVAANLVVQSDGDVYPDCAGPNCAPAIGIDGLSYLAVQ